jgi:hypothetical protein
LILLHIILLFHTHDSPFFFFFSLSTQDREALEKTKQAAAAQGKAGDHQYHQTQGVAATAGGNVQPPDNIPMEVDELERELSGQTRI